MEFFAAGCPGVEPCPPNASANLRPDRGWASMNRFDGPPATAHPSGEGLPRKHGKSRLLGRRALAGVRSGSRVGDALRLPRLEDDHLAAAVDGCCLGDVRNPDEQDCCAGETDDERQEREDGNVSPRRLMMNSRECGLADTRNVGFEDDFGSDDVVRPVVGGMSARGHTKYVGWIRVRVVPCSSDAVAAASAVTRLWGWRGALEEPVVPCHMLGPRERSGGPLRRVAAQGAPRRPWSRPGHLCSGSSCCSAAEPPEHSHAKDLPVLVAAETARLYPVDTAWTERPRGLHERLAIGEHVGQRNLAVTANTYTHVLADETEFDYSSMLVNAHAVRAPVGAR